MPKIDPTKLTKEIKNKYSVVSNAFRLSGGKKEKVKDGKPKDLIITEVGDVKQEEFYPQVKIGRWGDNDDTNEVNLSVRLIDNEIGKETLATENDKIKWSKGNKTARFYEIEPNEDYPEGAFEFDIELAKKPKTNKIEFSLNTKRVDFYYQPALTKEFKSGYSEEFKKEIIVTETDVKDLDGNVLVHRPKNVVDSYVSYYQQRPQTDTAKKINDILDLMKNRGMTIGTDTNGDAPTVETNNEEDEAIKQRYYDLLDLDYQERTAPGYLPANVIYPIDKSKYTLEELNQMVLAGTHLGKINKKGELEYFEYGKKYKVGKVGHIYRPKIYDATGASVWGILSIDKEAGKLTVEIPHDFLDKAVYPVVVDPTFGYTSVGASSEASAYNYIVGFPTTGTLTDYTITSISAYLSGGSSTAKARLGIWKTSGGALVDYNQTEITGDLGAAGWETDNTAIGATTDVTSYRIGIHRGGTGTKHTAYYDSSGGFWIYATYSSGLPNPLGSVTSGDKYSIYATYTAGGGAVSKTTSAKARIKVLGTLNKITAKARIKQSAVAKTATIKARLKTAGTTRTLTLGGRINQSAITKKTTFLGRIKQDGNIKTTSSRARMKTESITKTITIKARMKTASISKTMSIRGRLKQAGTDKTESTRARIKKSGNSSAITSRAMVKTASVEKKTTIRARVKNLTTSSTETSRARVKTTAEKKTSAQARIRQGWIVDGMIYTHRIKLTTDQTKVDTADLTDFPVMVKLTTTNFDFAESNADGFDIRFTSNDGSTLIKFEREVHDGSSLAVYWVKIPTVEHATDTDFYMYFRTEDTVDGADPENVWDSNFKAVHHLKDNTTSAVLDSTSNNNDGTKKGANEPVEASGQIYKAQDFDGTDDYVSLGSGASINITGALAIEAWVYIDSVTGEPAIIDLGNLNYGITTYRLGEIWFYIGGNGDNDAHSNCGTGAWHHIAGTWDGTTGENGMKLYIDGALAAQHTSTYNTTNASGDTLKIGNRSSYYFDGKIDEVRISNVARSAAWIKASYHAGNDTLLNYGSTEEYATSRYIATMTRIKKNAQSIATSKARIKSYGLQKAISAKSRIEKTELSELQILSRVKLLANSKLTTIRGRIEKIEGKQTTTRVRIKNTSTKTTTLRSRIEATKSMVMTMMAKISDGTEKMLTMRGRIKQSGITKLISARSRIKLSGNDRKTTIKARILKSVSSLMISRGRIETTSSVTETSRARIKISAIEKTMSMMARIHGNINNAYISIGATVKNTNDTLLTSRARINATSTGIIALRLRLKNSADYVISFRSRMKSPVSQTIASRARLVAKSNYRPRIASKGFQSVGIVKPYAINFGKRNQETVTTPLGR